MAPSADRAEKRAPNRARGEVVAVLAGEPRRLCLTLGALAEIEAALDVESPAAIVERLRSPSAADLSAVLAAMLGGGAGGEGEGERAAGRAQDAVDPAEAAAAVSAAFLAAARMRASAWPALLRLAATRFAVAPEAFWRLSLIEWRALTGADDAADPLQRRDLDALLAAYPDDHP